MAGFISGGKYLIILNMAYPNKILPHYTYQDYCQWKGPWELIDGIPYAMCPMPGPNHQKIASKLTFEFQKTIEKEGCECSVYQPIDYKISEDTILNPDLLIVCKPIIKQFLDFAPDLVVEILSPTTALKDRYTKFEIYQQQQIPYYLIVDIDIKRVEVWQLNHAEKYSQLLIEEKKPQVFAFNDCSISIVFENIWR